jgi:hypothetical protein
LISVYEFHPSSYEMLRGIYVSGRLPESLKGVDGDCFVADAEPIQAEGSYTPRWLSALKASSVQGTVEKLSSNDNDYLVVEPALPFPIRIYAHTETITVGVKTYFLFKEALPDGPSGSFQASYAPSDEGKYLLLRTADGRDASFLYPLGKISELPSGTWCFTYRAIRSGGGRVMLCVDVSIIDSSGSVVMKLAEKEALTRPISDRYWNTYPGWWSFYGLQLEPSHAYLKVDYYAYVSVAGSGTVYLVVDDPDLGPDDNTMVGTWNAPSSLRRLSLSVGGSSNTASWVKLVWGASSMFNASDVSVTLQLYNYAEGRYPTSGDGFISYTSQANVEQLISQEVASNPERFRDADGSWRMLINATATSPFKAYFDHVFYNATYAAYYVVQPAFTFTELKTTGATVKLAVDMASNYSLGSLPVEVALWNYRASRWDVVYSYTSNPSPGQLDVIRFEVASGAADYVSGSGEARLYVKATSSTGPFRQWIDMLRLTQYAR